MPSVFADVLKKARQGIRDANMTVLVCRHLNPAVTAATLITGPSASVLYVTPLYSVMSQQDTETSKFRAQGNLFFG